MPATMSILGLYTYDNTIFDLLQLPDGVIKDTLIDNLLSELAELEILYANPEVMKALIGVWSAKRLTSWNKLYNTTIVEYDPISNYDRKEEWNDDRTNTNTTNSKVNSTINNTDNQTRQVAGYNTEALVNESAVNGNNDSTTNGTEETTANRTENATRKGRAYGNIGVTTTQQMLEAERDVSEFDIYSYIISDFKQRFCLMVY